MLVSSAISGEVISRYGSEAQKKTWLPRMASGESKVVFAITEPDAGSNTLKMSTTAVRDGDDWVLNGTKYYISGRRRGRCRARRGPHRHRRDERQGAPVAVYRADRRPWPHRAAAAGVCIPSRAAVHAVLRRRAPDRASTWSASRTRASREVFHGLNPERIVGAAICVGVGRYALEKTAEYARTRKVWDVPIGSHQGVSHVLAKAKIEVELAALMTSKAAWLHDNGRPAGEASNMAKYAAAEAALAAVDAAIQTHGGNGLSTEYGLIPLWGIVRLLRIAPVSREMVLNYVAQHTLGLPRSY